MMRVGAGYAGLTAGRKVFRRMFRNFFRFYEFRSCCVVGRESVSLERAVVRFCVLASGWALATATLALLVGVPG